MGALSGHASTAPIGGSLILSKQALAPTYAVNPAGAPADYMSFIKAAIEAAHQTWGLKFV